MYLILTVWPHSEDDLNMTSFLTPFFCSFLAKWKKKKEERGFISACTRINTLTLCFACLHLRKNLCEHGVTLTGRGLKGLGRGIRLARK